MNILWPKETQWQFSKYRKRILNSDREEIRLPNAVGVFNRGALDRGFI